MQLLVWLRMPGDILFSIGVLMLVVFVGKLFLGRSRRQEVPVPDSAQVAGRTAR
jgi:nitric oxide reductase subunit B